MKKILVPCDFSNPAIDAFRFAIEVANQSGGEIILLHSIELPVTYDTTMMPSLYFEEQALKDMKESAEKHFKKLQTKWVKGNLKVSSIIEYGPVTPTITRFAEEKKADLIVMGTKGASGLKDYFVGSNTEKIVRKSSVPVIAVKKYVKASAIRNIVFPNTLQNDQEDLTMKVKALQEFFKAKIHILYVNTPTLFRDDKQTRKELNDFAKRFMFRNFTLNIYNDIDREEGVMNFAHGIGADMIAMGTHGRRGLNHLTSGSIAENVVNHIDCPIWTCVEK